MNDNQNQDAWSTSTVAFGGSEGNRENTLSGYVGDILLSNMIEEHTNPHGHAPRPPSKTPWHLLLIIVAALGLIWVAYKKLKPKKPAVVMVDTPRKPKKRIKKNIPTPVVERVAIQEVAEAETIQPIVDDFSELEIPEAFARPQPLLTEEITPDITAQIKDLFAHPFPYKRMEAVQQLRKLRIKGSENLLRLGMEQKKFWVRMEALFALAEIGAALKTSDLEKAIGDARPYLLENYFKRFSTGASQGEKFILSLCMYFVPEKPQALIASVLQNYQ